MHFTASSGRVRKIGANDASERHSLCKAGVEKAREVVESERSVLRSQREQILWTTSGCDKRQEFRFMSVGISCECDVDYAIMYPATR